MYGSSRRPADTPARLLTGGQLSSFAGSEIAADRQSQISPSFDGPIRVVTGLSANGCTAGPSAANCIGCAATGAQLQGGPDRTAPDRDRWGLYRVGTPVVLPLGDFAQASGRRGILGRAGPYAALPSDRRLDCLICRRDGG